MKSRTTDIPIEAYRFWFSVALALAVGLWAAASADAKPADDIAALEHEIAAAAHRYAGADSAAYQTNYPLARLALKKAKLSLERGSRPSEVTKHLTVGHTALKDLAAGRTYRAYPGALTELAYIADNDGSVQPYYLYLPGNYSTDRDWPLIVFLHGYVPSITVLDPWLPSSEVFQAADQAGCIFLVPYGRRNTDFQGIGEVDVLRSIREVERLYSIDQRHIYLMGVSMGGMGTWNLALRHPGRFAAAAPISGHTDMFRWWGWPRQQVPGFKRWLVEWDNPLDQVINLRSQSVFVQHGSEDSLIPTEQSRLMKAQADELVLPLNYHEINGGGHYVYLQPEVTDRAIQWLSQQQSQINPRWVSFKTYSLEYNEAFWVTVEDFLRWGVPAELHAIASVQGDRLRLRTENIRRLKVNAEQAPLQVGEELTLIVNGQKLMKRADEHGEIHITIGDSLSENTSLHKRKGLCGPVEEVFDTAFALVRGTTGTRTERAEIRAKVDRWAAHWQAFSDGWPRIVDDVDVTEQMMGDYNLVLFGTPATNAILAEIAGELPIGIEDHRYTVGDEVHAGENLGLVMCYPNPLSPGRYVAVYSGEYYGERLPTNHKFDLLPDFIVFTADQYDYDQTNLYNCAGFFDMDWQLSDRLMWRTPRAQ